MNNVTIEPGSEIYIGSYSLKFAPKPEDKYVPKNYDEECICNGLRLLSEGKTEEGLKYLLIAWADADLWAGELLSYGYTANWFGENNFPKALQILYKMVDRGYPMAMNNLGTMYMEGSGVNRSDRWAKYWFEKAVAHGCTFAMVNLANMLTLGPKKYRDYCRAVELLKMAMAEDDPEAFNMMGLCYHEGRGVPKDDRPFSITNSATRKALDLWLHIILAGAIFSDMELIKILIWQRYYSRKPKKEDSQYERS